jgi:hypothetical protein
MMIDSVPDDYITAAKIADSAITESNIKSFAFTAPKFGADFLTEGKIADNAFDEEHITTAFADKIAGAFGSYSTDTALILTMVQNNPTDFKGTTGSGAYEDTIYAIDTSGADVAVTGVTIAAYNSSGIPQGSDKTNSDGYVVLSLDADTWTVTGSAQTYSFPSGQSVTTAAHQVDSIFGYDFALSTAATAKHCDVTVYVMKSDGTASEGTKITASLVGSNHVDSSGYAIDNTPMVKRTDSDGKAVFTCVWSSYIIGAPKWQFKVTGRTVGVVKQTVTIPRQSSYELEF